MLLGSLHLNTGTLKSKIVTFAPPTGTSLLTSTMMILLGAWMETPTSVVPPPIGTSDLQDSCLTLLQSFRDNMGIMLQFLTWCYSSPLDYYFFSLMTHSFLLIV